MSGWEFVVLTKVTACRIARIWWRCWWNRGLSGSTDLIPSSCHSTENHQCISMLFLMPKPAALMISPVSSIRRWASPSSTELYVPENLGVSSKCEVQHLSRYDEDNSAVLQEVVVGYCNLPTIFIRHYRAVMRFYELIALSCRKCTHAWCGHTVLYLVWRVDKFHIGALSHLYANVSRRDLWPLSSCWPCVMCRFLMYCCNAAMKLIDDNLHVVMVVVMRLRKLCVLWVNNHAITIWLQQSPADKP